MSANPAAPTDEPSSHPSNRLSRSPDEDAGKATPAQNGSRGLFMTAPRSLSSLPTGILQHIFTQLHQSLRSRVLGPLEDCADRCDTSFSTSGSSTSRCPSGRADLPSWPTLPVQLPDVCKILY
ncbi:hypothetical protein NBRC10512_001180 [Rhodotorula toruloides]|uniref:RHTO0S06e03774g1_1 n=2 Tax=Rhodotorula toruloides TaxID=5286 RepID=A0A061B3Q3_RHOTO|nr:uncharacterized protein RHTO_06162 [Rhodotorula toruloides NP11]EMS24158.1 hypothetical protein RHTO_06162 [Rhodotorula toruloides NP11]CDR41643.1 RHTO0S06e03774g1_1 [Rhodotorula toruloides]